MAVECIATGHSTLLHKLGGKTGMVAGAELDAQLLALLLESFAAAHHIYEDVTIMIAKQTDTADPCDPYRYKIHWLGMEKK